MSGPASPNLAGSLRTPILFGMILVLAAALRAWHIDSAPFWLDEHLTVELSNGHGLAHLDLPRGEIISPVPDYIGLSGARPWYDIWKNSARDVHPPLFYMVLRLWREIFGESDATTRALSAALSLAAIVALFIAVKAQAGATPALWASLLMSVAAIQIEFAQETRSYMLLQACLLGACAALLRIERYGNTWPRTIALGVLLLAAMFTHLLALPLVGTMGLYALTRLRGNARRQVVGTMLLAVAMFALVWGPFALAQSDGYLTRTSFVQSWYWSIDQWFIRLMGLPLKHFVSAPTRSRFIASMGAALYILPLLLMKQRPALLIWWLWLVIGVFSIAAADLARHGAMLDYLRYTLAVSPAAYALAAMMLAHLDGWFRHIVPLLLSLACLGAIQGAYIRLNPNWRGLDNLVNAKIGSEDMLIMIDTEPDPWRVRCNVVGIQYYARHKPHCLALLDSPPPPSVEKRIREAREVWVFASPDDSITAQSLFPGAREVEHAFFQQIGTLVRIELAPEPASVPASLPELPSVVPSTEPARPAQP